MISDGGDCSEDNRKVKKKKSNHVEGGRRSVTGSWRVTPRLKAEDDGRWWAAGRSGRDAGSSHRLTGQGQGEAGGRAARRVGAAGRGASLAGGVGGA